MNNPGFKKGGAPGGGGDTVLESRHLVGLFLGVVVLCGVFFTLGYVMGRTQYETSVNAASNPKINAPVKTSPAIPGAADASAATNPPGAVVPSEWNFYKAGEAKKTDAKPEAKAAATTLNTKPATSSIVPVGNSSAPIVSSKPAEKKLVMQTPVIPKGAVVLQVAALTREGDALALAETLQQKRFPAYVLPASTGNLVRVQVGPFADMESANLAKKSLEREGFKAIVKR
ncbi:MAG: SPOR domain-containing protein [Acidobacteria bacterium]|nr:SPOR domain-containing protein [Acidobacteriota bacterium]